MFPEMHLPKFGENNLGGFEYLNCVRRITIERKGEENPYQNSAYSSSEFVVRLILSTDGIEVFQFSSISLDGFVSLIINVCILRRDKWR